MAAGDNPAIGPQDVGTVRTTDNSVTGIVSHTLANEHAVFIRVEYFGVRESTPGTYAAGEATAIATATGGAATLRAAKSTIDHDGSGGQYNISWSAAGAVVTFEIEGQAGHNVRWCAVLHAVDAEMVIA
jgi:hypothetical protein